MGNSSSSGPETGRLDSWKEIARYLGRDTRTVRRWERELGLPVRRMRGARGRSVFAYADEIEAWLRDTQSAPKQRRRGRLQWLAVSLAAACVLAAAFAWRVRAAPASADGLRVTTTSDGVVARNAAGVEQWRFAFPSDFDTALPTLDMGEPSRVVAGVAPAVYVATHARARRSDHQLESGTLYELDLRGRPRRSFSFSDTVTLDHTRYTGPWAITSFAIDETGGERRIAVAAHHFMWNASVVTVLDASMHRHGTFIHNGWIEGVRWVAPDRMVISGFSNTHDGGMIALLDGAVRPIRMMVMPRSALNRAKLAQFNRAVAQLTPAGLVARTIEVPATAGSTSGSIEAIYEMDRSLNVLRASYSDAYRDAWRAMTRSPSPANRPDSILVWDAASGWRVERLH